MDLIPTLNVYTRHRSRHRPLASNCFSCGTAGAEQFAHKILSHSELNDWNAGHPEHVRFLAVRFSVKEAAYKALYPTIRPTWKELSYHSFSSDFPGSKPSLIFNPTIAIDRNRAGELLVSMCFVLASTFTIRFPRF
ncbi:4 -phosphopantetheinyl transferase [Pyrrhoderma noxium]|uniref:4-phosphopantetheinyl transferase n=1 Tax=Pyrrhoderma noxium TaxID=2282107 RepID=A0A286UN79_9AGAM|nr:4 -phosphopantetheinyl transferase [Pyrrhoderma noxium]